MLNETERRRFLAALQQDDEFRAAVRGQLLGDDLLALPETVKGLAASTKQLARTAVELTKGLADLSRAVEALAGRVDRRFDAVDKRFDAVDRRFDAVDERFDGLEARFDRLEGRFDRLEGRFGNLDGRDYERTAREQAASFLSSVPGRLRRIRVVDTSDLADRLDDAVDDGRIDNDERDDALGADLVCTARRPGSEETVWVVAEVSITLDSGEVARAARRSETIRRAFGVEAIAVGVCATLPDELDTDGVFVVRHQVPRAA